MTPSPFDAWITFGYTRDLEATTRFYQEIFGLPLALDQGGCRIWKVRDGAYVGFCDRPKDERDGVMLTLVTDDVDGWQRRLETAGVPIDQPAQPNPEYGIRHLFCRDPNGYVVEIQHFDDPDWDRASR